MAKHTLYLALTQTGLTVTTTDNPNALVQIAMATDYVFDSNTQLTVKVTDSKESATPDDPLNHLVFSILISDKVDNKQITSLTGRLYVGGGIEALEQNFPQKFSYISRKLDFYGAMDSENDFFDAVETRYNKEQVTQIIAKLKEFGVFNTLSDYRVHQKVLQIPKTANDVGLTAEQVRTILAKSDKPNYFALANVDDLAMLESVVAVMDKFNNHLFVDLGSITDWRQIVALKQSLAFKDHRIRFVWNPNLSRPNGANSVLTRKKWRPCVGDYLAKHLLRNAMTNNQGIPPIHIPVAGYHFPVEFKDMRQMAGVVLDEEAQNALADAQVIVVLNETYQSESRWIYGDVLTQRDSDTSALRLANASEIATFTANSVIDIIKKHMLTRMSAFLQNAYDDCEKFLNACVSAGLLVPSEQLGGQYYALSITPRADNPFEKVDVKFARRPEGAVRQAYLETTINK
ncbi:hypothetical protein [Faucicola boevrei]|uniref:hypothetical protein n=1 Tax=Faucicola boevrei TaxID=346665 RepID=UPI00035CCC90|nr:hypothetical protein [Moraxella boevrei]